MMVKIETIGKSGIVILEKYEFADNLKGIELQENERVVEITDENERAVAYEILLNDWGY